MHRRTEPPVVIQVSGEVLIRQLEYLVALSREQHFGRAARACHVSQPTLSTAIRKLERDLNVTIVLRGRGFLGFTEEGGHIIGWANRILAERDSLLADLDRMRIGLSATIRLGAIPTAIPATPLITDRVTERHPQARIQIEALSSQQIGRRLAEFDLDAGVTYIDHETPLSTRRFELYREHYFLLAPADQSLAHEPVVNWEAAAELPLCVLNTSMRNRRILDAAMASAGAHLTPVVETDNVGALYAHIATRRFASIVAQTWLHAFGVPGGMRAQPMAELSAQPIVGLVTPDREPASIVATALVDALDGADISTVLDQTSFEHTQAHSQNQ